MEQLRVSKIQADSGGGIDGVTLSLQMALMYVLDVGILQRREDGEGQFTLILFEILLVSYIHYSK